MSIKSIIEHSVKRQKAIMLHILVDQYYETDGTGGRVHIVLDDGNYEKHHIEFCLKNSIKEKDYWGEVICNLLLEFNKEEIEQILERSWEIDTEIYE